MRRIVLIFLALTLAAGCGSRNDRTPSSGAKSGGLSIVATIFPVYDFARAVAGEAADLTMLVKPGASVHSFDPAPADIISIQNADVFIYIGGASDTWVDKIIGGMDTSGKTVLRLMDYVNTVEEVIVAGMEPEEEDEDGGPELDEHIWTSPQNAIKLINAITGALSGADSTNASQYRKNADDYIGELKKIDKEITDIVSSAAYKKIVVADRFPFRYFVDEYDLEYSAAFGGCSDQSDASVATIAYLIDAVIQDNIPFIFYVELSSRNVADVISKQTGAEALLLHSCHNVTRTEFEAGATYLSLMRQNTENLNKGLNYK